MNIEESIVVITNRSHRPFHGHCGPDRAAVILDPGQSRRVPIEWARTWFGDDRSLEGPNRLDTDGDGKVDLVIAPRAMEYERLKHLWGAATSMHMWDPAFSDYSRPEVEVHTLDGTRLIMVLDDPEGTSVNPATQTQAESGILLDRIAALENQLAMMSDLRDAGATTIPATVTENDLPKDDSERRGPGRPRKYTNT
jgi:hypothetical protein